MENTTQTHPNLIAKLTEFWKANNKRIKAGVAAGVVALSLSACKPATINPTDGTTPGTSTSQPVNQNGPSSILNSVLHDDYYQDVALDYRANGVYANQKFKPIPYGYLEKMGHDVEAIKNNEIKCYSSFYTKAGAKNSLFVSTRVECNDASEPYYDCYTLEYKLTNKEMAEFEDMADGNYFEAILFLQAASYLKTPTVLGNTAITIDEFDDLSKIFTRDVLSKNIFGTNKTEIDFLGFNKADKSFQFQVRVRPNISSTELQSEGQISQAEAFSKWQSLGTLKDKPNVLSNGTDFSDFKDNGYETYKNNVEDITYYRSEPYLNIGYENELGNSK